MTVYLPFMRNLLGGICSERFRLWACVYLMKIC